MLNNNCNPMNTCMNEEICVEHKNLATITYNPIMNNYTTESGSRNLMESKPTMIMSNVNVNNSYRNVSNEIIKSENSSSNKSSVRSDHGTNLSQGNNATNHVTYEQKEYHGRNAENFGSDYECSRTENETSKNTSGVSYSTENGMSQNTSEDSSHPKECSQRDNESVEEQAETIGMKNYNRKELWNIQDHNIMNNMKHMERRNESIKDTPINCNNNINMVWGEEGYLSCYEETNHSISGNRSTIKREGNHPMRNPNLNHMKISSGSLGKENHIIHTNAIVGNKEGILTTNYSEHVRNPSNSNRNHSNNHSIENKNENQIDRNQNIKLSPGIMEYGDFNTFTRQCNEPMWEVKGKQGGVIESNRNIMTSNNTNSEVNTKSNNTKEDKNTQSNNMYNNMKEPNEPLTNMNYLYTLMRTNQFDAEALEETSHPDTKQFDFVTCRSECNESENNSTDHYSFDQRDNATKKSLSSNTKYIETTNQRNTENTYEKRKVVGPNTEIAGRDLLNVNNGFLEEFIENNNNTTTTNNNNTNKGNNSNVMISSKNNTNHVLNTNSQHDSNKIFHHINNNANTDNESSQDLMNSVAYARMSMNNNSNTHSNNTTLYTPNHIVDMNNMNNHFGIHNSNSNTNSAKTYMNSTLNQVHNQGTMFSMSPSSNQHPSSNNPSVISSITYSHDNQILNQTAKDIYDMQQESTNNLSPLRRSCGITTTNTTNHNNNNYNNNNNVYGNISNMQLEEQNGIITINGMNHPINTMNYLNSSNNMNNASSPMNQINSLNQMNSNIDSLNNIHNLNSNMNGVMNNQQLFKMQMHHNSNHSKSNSAQLNTLDYMSPVDVTNSFLDLGKVNNNNMPHSLPNMYSNYSQELSLYSNQMNQASAIRHNEIYPYARNYVGKQRNSSSTLPTGNYNRNMTHSVLNGINRNILNSPMEPNCSQLYDQSNPMNGMNPIQMNQNDSHGFHGIKQENNSNFKNEDMEMRRKHMETMRKYKKVKKVKTEKITTETKKKKEKEKEKTNEQSLKEAVESVKENEEYEEQYGSTLPKIKGVRFDRLGKRWVASWSQNGSQKRQYFPIKKYGTVQSKYLAVYARIKALRYINKIKKNSEHKSTTGNTKNMDHLYEDLFHNLQFIFVHQFKNNDFDKECYDMMPDTPKWDDPDQHIKKEKNHKQYDDNFKEAVESRTNQGLMIKTEMQEPHQNEYPKKRSIEKREENNNIISNKMNIYSNINEDPRTNYHNNNINQSIDLLSSQTYSNQYEGRNQSGQEHFVSNRYGNAHIKNNNDGKSNIQIKQETINEHFEKIRNTVNQYGHNLKDDDEDDDEYDEDEEEEDEDDE